MRLAVALASALLLVVVSAVASPSGATGPAAAAAVSGSAPASAAVAPAAMAGLPDARDAQAAASRSRCSLEVLHPIEVQAVLVDDMAPGRWLRAAVRVQSRVDLADVEVHLEPVGAAELAGPRKTTTAEVAAERPYEHPFDVRVPDTAAPQQVRVRIRGRAQGQPIERGTVLHLLPRGVVDPGVESPVRSGTQRVLEQRRASRRVR